MFKNRRLMYGIAGAASILALTQATATSNFEDGIQADQLTDGLYLYSSIQTRTLESGKNTSDLGRVSVIIINGEGDAVAALVNYGSVFGFGGKQIALDFSNIELFKNGDDLHLSVNASVEDFENVPEFQPELVGLETDVRANSQAIASFSVEAMLGDSVLSSEGDALGTVSDVVLQDDGSIVAIVLNQGGLADQHTLLPSHNLQFGADHLTVMPSEPVQEVPASAAEPDVESDLFLRPELQILIS